MEFSDSMLCNIQLNKHFILISVLNTSDKMSCSILAPPIVFCFQQKRLRLVFVNRNVFATDETAVYIYLFIILYIIGQKHRREQSCDMTAIQYYSENTRVNVRCSSYSRTTRVTISSVFVSRGLFNSGASYNDNRCFAKVIYLFLLT